MIRPGPRNSPLGLRRPTLQRSNDRFGFRARDAEALVQAVTAPRTPGASYSERVKARNTLSRLPIGRNR